MNDFYQGEEVLPAFTLSNEDLRGFLLELIDELKDDIAKTRFAIEQLEKDPRKDGLQSADFKHAKNLFESLHRDLYDATIWEDALNAVAHKSGVGTMLQPHQARWLYRYQADPSIRHRLRK